MGNIIDIKTLQLSKSKVKKETDDVIEILECNVKEIEAQIGTPMTEAQINEILKEYSNKYDIVFYDEIMASIYGQYMLKQDSTILYISINKCLSRVSQFYRVNFHRVNEPENNNLTKQPIFIDNKLSLSMVYIIDKELITERLNKMNMNKEYESNE